MLVRSKRSKLVEFPRPWAPKATIVTELPQRNDVNDPFDLERFVAAQGPAYEAILVELQQASKTGHWMWFVFPQLEGLGSSWAANHYGISSLTEAKAYLDHPILGRRLLECSTIVDSLVGHSAEEIFGWIDSLKFRSSMTLFSQVSQHEPVFATALEKYFAGKPDQLTLDRLAQRERKAKA